MGSSFLNTPNKPWTPADAVLRDCSQGICSFFCPQWCSAIYPPPPSPSIIAIGVAATAGGDDDDSSSSSFRLSPLIVALIGILASAFVLITYYTIISRFCTRRTRIHQNDTGQWENDNDESAIQASANTGGGLDDAIIRSITVRKYQKGDGSMEGTDCSVCLSEFQDRENVRLLPKCNHAFHLPCIDPWLRSHSSCPLCRSDIIISDTSSSSSSSGNLPNQRENSQFQEASRTQSVNVSSALEYQYRNDTVIVIHGSEQEIQVGFAGNLEERNGSELNQDRLLLVADILRSSGNEDEDEELEIGSSKQNQREEEKRKVRSE